MILALTKKVRGDKKLHWEGFLFDTDIQSYVEHFMIATFQPNYVLVDPVSMPKHATSGNYVMRYGYQVFATEVHVDTISFDGVVAFTIKDHP